MEKTRTFHHVVGDEDGPQTAEVFWELGETAFTSMYPGKVGTLAGIWNAAEVPSDVMLSLTVL